MGDRAVSPVVGTVLMVGLTVALASGAYLWLRGAVEGSENSFADVEGRGLDRDEDGSVEALELHKTRGAEASTRVVVQASSGRLEVGTDWSPGAWRRLPCLGAGAHQVTVSEPGSLVASFKLVCDEPAPEVLEDGSGDEGGSGSPCRVFNSDLVCQNTTWDRVG